MWQHLDTLEVRRLAFVTAMGAAAIGGQVIARRRQVFSLWDWVWIAAGLLAAVVVACGAAILSGTTLPALANMTFLSATKHASVIFSVMTLRQAAIILAILSLAISLQVCLSARFPRWRQVALISMWMLRAVFVGRVLLYAWTTADSCVAPSYFSEIVFPLLWLGLVPDVEPTGARLAWFGACWYALLPFTHW